jgi:Flp pilus assembly protein TadG
MPSRCFGRFPSDPIVALTEGDTQARQQNRLVPGPRSIYLSAKPVNRPIFATFTTPGPSPPSRNTRTPSKIYPRPHGGRG